MTVHYSLLIFTVWIVDVLRTQIIMMVLKKKYVVICYAINGSLNYFISAVSDSGDSLYWLLSFSMCVQLFP